MGKINIYFEEISMLALPKRKMYGFIFDILAMENSKCGTINFIFCNDSYLLKINNEFLKHDFYTDIITFDYSENKIISGDLFLSLDRIKENAILYKISLMDEILRVMVHGILHMVGYNDKTRNERKMMKEKENFYLEKSKQKQ
jgi:probable rRNA maturation factor